MFDFVSTKDFPIHLDYVTREGVPDYRHDSPWIWLHPSEPDELMRALQFAVAVLSNGAFEYPPCPKTPFKDEHSCNHKISKGQRNISGHVLDVVSESICGPGEIVVTAGTNRCKGKSTVIALVELSYRTDAIDISFGTNSGGQHVEPRQFTLTVWGANNVVKFVHALQETVGRVREVLESAPEAKSSEFQELNECK